MSDSGITYLLWHDLVGMTRTRGIPSRAFDAATHTGLGWACAGQALTAFTDIVENPWGPMDEVRQVPDPQTAFSILGDTENPSFDAVICDSKTSEGVDWECCGRGFLRAALDDLRAETGLGIYASFEHEFSVSGEAFLPSAPFSIAAARQKNAFLTDIEKALHHAGLKATSIEPEFGLAQYEVACAPETGIRAADACLMAREIIREIARRHNLAASFTPKPGADAVGNGAHVHLSLINADGVNQTYDADRPMQLSQTAAQFCAGILKHLDALVALTAPTPISYYRLGPHHWSCGFKAVGLQNREAALRITPGVGGEDKKRKGHNIEYRPCDATASPYLVLGALVRAGLEGIRAGDDTLFETREDPAEMSQEARDAAGITALPASLETALAALEQDQKARSWFSQDMFNTYVALKRWEIDQAATLLEEDIFAQYRTTY